MVGLKDFNMPSCCNSCEHWSFSRDDEPLCDLTYEYISQFDKRQEDCPLVETYTKADMVAMLEEISLEIEEKTKDPALDDYDCGFNTGVYVSRDIIQQKINKLKEVEDGND